MMTTDAVPAKAIDAKARTAIIAGNGLLPQVVAEALEKKGNPPFVICLKGEADEALKRYDHDTISVVEFSRLIRLLKQANISNVVLAGGVRQRPLLSDIRLDMTTLRALLYVFGALGKGDDALLRAFIRLLESYGFHMVGAHQIVPDILAPAASVLTSVKPDKKEQHNIDLALEAAVMLGKLDVGQGAVAVGGRVVALEGVEGTDNMLLRVQQMRGEKRIPQHGGVLVKCAKPAQDERADLPTIGVDTVTNIAAAGLAGIAIEAGRTVMLSYRETIDAANAQGLFIVTFNSSRVADTL
ncbi:LpxI family protein [Pseudochrobactrum sp. HB0163]|uniref:LpxI family protein n=1 Tax=Pseudochrobactrum sp. HB0163 TaxID=3450708 RepID=UPI003F6DBDDE